MPAVRKKKPSKKDVRNRILAERTTLQLAAASRMFMLLSSLSGVVAHFVPAEVQTELSDCMVQYTNACMHRDAEFKKAVCG